MNFDDLVSRYPRLWHATFEGGWDGIQSSGLLSAADLLETVGRGSEASAMRPEVVHLDAPFGPVVLRNQVLSRKDPEPCLDGITVEEWWQLVNGRSYFFVDQDDLQKLVDSCLELGIAQEVITLNTRRLLTDVADQVEVSLVSAGSFPRTTGPSRGPSTFQRIEAFDGNPVKIKEVTIPVPVTITDTAVVSVVSRHPKDDPRRLWPPVAA